MTDFHQQLHDSAEAYEQASENRKLWVRPKRNFGANVDTFGWICGNPILPSKTKWPMRNGEPYNFLCQLNCERIPSSFWKGLVPKKGWIAIFFAPTTEDHPFDTKIIYTRKWGTEIKLPQARLALNQMHIAEKYRKHLFPDVALELELFSPSYQDGKPIIPTWGMHRPFQGDEFHLSNPRSQPTDWDEMEILLRVAIDTYEEAYQKREKYKQELEEKRMPASHDKKNLEFFSSWLANAPATHKKLVSQLQDVQTLRKTHSFTTESLSSFYSWLDEVMNARFLSWHFQYDAVRKQRVHSKLLKDPKSVPPAVKDYFDTIWEHEAERTSMQIGGGPVGFSSSFFEIALTGIFLLNVPSSPIHALDFHGSSLNVSMPISRLMLRSFGKIYSDISN